MLFRGHQRVQLVASFILVIPERPNRSKTLRMTFLTKQGLYNPAHEHDSCGLGFVVEVCKPGGGEK
jgi:hypothetical protein